MENKTWSHAKLGPGSKENGEIEREARIINIYILRQLTFWISYCFDKTSLQGYAFRWTIYETVLTKANDSFIVSHSSLWKCTSAFHPEFKPSAMYRQKNTTNAKETNKRQHKMKIKTEYIDSGKGMQLRERDRNGEIESDRDKENMSIWGEERRMHQKNDIELMFYTWMQVLCSFLFIGFTLCSSFRAISQNT